MRRLDAIDCELCRIVRGPWHLITMRHAMASDLVSYQAIGRTLLPFEQFANKTFGCSTVTPSLQQDVEDVAVLVDGSPQIVPLPLNGHERFVHKPVIPQRRLVAPQFARVVGTESAAPTSNDFLAHRNPALCEQVLDISQTERKTMIEKDGVGDDLRRKTKAAKERASSVHG